MPLSASNPTFNSDEEQVQVTVTPAVDLTNDDIEKVLKSPAPEEDTDDGVSTTEQAATSGSLSKLTKKAKMAIAGVGLLTLLVVVIAVAATAPPHTEPTSSPGTTMAPTNEQGEPGVTGAPTTEGTSNPSVTPGTASPTREPTAPIVHPPGVGHTEPTVFCPEDTTFPCIGQLADMDFEEFLTDATAFATTKVMEAIDPEGSTEGSLQAALSKSCPDYAFTWARDQALVFAAVLELYKLAQDPAEYEQYEQKLLNYAAHTTTIYELNQANPEWSPADAKYFMDGKRYDGGWCQPQNDGPASRAIVLLRFIEAYEVKHPGQSVNFKLTTSNVATDNPIGADMSYLLDNWDSDNCEPWEEISGKHFYDRIVARRAFLEAANAIDGDIKGKYNAKAQETEAKIESHWKPGKRTIQPEASNNGGRFDDIQTTLAVMHSYSEVDGYFGPTDSRMMADAIYTIKSFDDYFTINLPGWRNQLDIGVAIGRYTNDRYGGFCPLPEEVCPGYGGGSGCPGQAWFLATNGMGEYMFRIAEAAIKAGSLTIDELNHPLFEYFGGLSIYSAAPTGSEQLVFTKAGQPEKFRQLVALLVHAGDSFLKRTRFHMSDTYRMDEQFNGLSGVQQSAGDLTWAYASLITAVNSRNRLNLASFEADNTFVGVEGKVQVNMVVARVMAGIDQVHAVVFKQGESAPTNLCANAVAFSKRKTVFGSFQEFSTFLTLDANSAYQVDLFNGADCGSQAQPEVVHTVQVSTTDVSPVEATVVSWCSEGGCQIPASATVKVVIRNVRGNQRHNVVLTGDNPILGSWSPCDGVHGVKSETEPGTWVFEVTMPTMRTFHYKAVTVSEEGDACGIVEWEHSGNSNLGPIFVDGMEVVRSWGCCDGCGECEEEQEPPVTQPPTPPQPTNPVTVKVSNAGSKESLYLAGSFNGWENPCAHEMAGDGQGAFTVTLALSPGDYQMKALGFGAGVNCADVADHSSFYEVGSNHDVSISANGGNVEFEVNGWSS